MCLINCNVIIRDRRMGTGVPRIIWWSRKNPETGNDIERPNQNRETTILVSRDAGSPPRDRTILRTRSQHTDRALRPPRTDCPVTEVNQWPSGKILSASDMWTCVDGTGNPQSKGKTWYHLTTPNNRPDFTADWARVGRDDPGCQRVQWGETAEK